jgi:hypothetical protein
MLARARNESLLRHALRCLLCAVQIVACDGASSSPSTDANAAMDGAVAEEAGAAGDASMRADGAASLADAAASCSDRIGSCPAQSFGKWTVLLDAADFGVDARLVALGGQAVLVQGGDGAFRVVLMDDDYDLLPDTTYSSWDFSSGDLVPFAITDGTVSARGRPLFVLACDADRTRCTLSQAHANRAQLSAWQSTELPAGFLPAGLVFDWLPELAPAICAYGNGLLCLREGWQEAIAPEPGLRINDVDMDGPWSLAIADHGRWFKRDLDDSSAWREQSALSDVALTHVSAARSGAVIVGDGRVQAALGEQAQYFTCGPPGELLALTLEHGSPGLAYAVTNAGVVLQHPPPHLGAPEPFCAYDQLPAGPVRDVSFSYCWDSPNPRVLLDQVVFGQNECVRVF